MLSLAIVVVAKHHGTGSIEMQMHYSTWQTVLWTWILTGVVWLFRPFLLLLLLLFVCFACLVDDDFSRFPEGKWWRLYAWRKSNLSSLFFIRKKGMGSPMMWSWRDGVIDDFSLPTQHTNSLLSFSFALAVDWNENFLVAKSSSISYIKHTGSKFQLTWSDESWILIFLRLRLLYYR